MRRGSRRGESLWDNKLAVSEVIGVILMVALTVALAAIVATFVYGYKGSMEQKPTPAFSVTRKEDNVSVVLNDKGVQRR